MKIAILSGGVGGAKCIRAASDWAKRRNRDSLGNAPNIEVTAIVNVGDDFDHLGLRVCPDLDSVLYRLANMSDTERGWGRNDDSDRVIREIIRHNRESGWFHLGDLDIAHNLMRTAALRSGVTLSEFTRQISIAYGVDLPIIPVTNDPSPTRVQFGDTPRVKELSFQEWWVKQQATPKPTAFSYPQATTARLAPRLAEVIKQADLILLAPSNPVVSITPILEVGNMRGLLRSSPAPIIGISPIVEDKPIRGWADRCLEAVGVECNALAIANFYGSRTDSGILDAWIVDEREPVFEPKHVCVPTHRASIIFRHDSRDDAIFDKILDIM